MFYQVGGVLKKNLLLYFGPRGLKYFDSFWNSVIQYEIVQMTRANDRCCQLTTQKIVRLQQLIEQSLIDILYVIPHEFYKINFKLLLIFNLGFFKIC